MTLRERRESPTPCGARRRSPFPVALPVVRLAALVAGALLSGLSVAPGGPAFLAPGVAIAAGVRLTGTVLDAETLRPIEGAEVELANTSGGQGYFRERTDGRGTFEMEGIATERYYTLTVSAPGYADFLLTAWQFPSPERAVAVEIPLDRAGSLEVRVTGADGRPLAGARVAVRSERAQRWWEGYRPEPPPIFTDRAGVSRFVDLTAGYWTVAVEASGLLAFESRRVPVRRGETTPVPVRMVRPASLSGVVRLADGTGVANLSVLARGPAEGIGTTGADGTFTVPDLPPGRYRLEANHEGFELATTKESFALKEGGSRDGISITVTPRPAELAFVLEREAFVPDATIRIGVRSFRIGLVDLSLFEIPEAVLLDGANDFRRLADSADTTGLVPVERWRRPTAEGAPWTWREEEMALPPEIPPGAYLLRGRAGDLERRAIFFVTDLGLLLKRSATRMLVSAASLKTGLPVAGASVYAVATREMRAAEGQDWSAALPGAGPVRAYTDGQGMMLVPLSDRSPRLRVVVVSDAHGIAVAEAPLAPAAEQGGDQLFLYTERPIYRPGQTVYWKGFARKAAGAGYAMPDATTAPLTLAGPEGASLALEPAKVSARGSIDGAIQLPAEIPVGEWTLGATVGRASRGATFAVQEYRKPEFRVEVTPDREVYVNGDEVRFTLAAAYFFGAPVFGALVRYSLFESRIRSSSEREELEEEPGAGYGRVLKTGETRTDVDGRAALLFTPERVSYDRRLTLEVEVVDPSSRRVSARGSAVMGRGLFSVALRPSSRLVEVGAPVAVEVSTRDHTGKPVRAAVTVELDQDAWNPLERRYVRSTRPLATTEATTDATGRALVSLTPAPARSGSLSIRARTEDAKGNRITAEASVWVYDRRVSEYAYRYPTLEAFPDRERYAAGDTARIVVNTEVRDAKVLATVEGRDLHDLAVVPLSGNTGLVAFPIRAEYAPNVFVSLQVRKGKEVHSRTLDLSVEAERHDLAIELRADREEYRPGDEARIAVETKGADGTPRAAEVSVGVVDEAIYALRPDRTPDPHDVFYGRRPNWVTTTVAFPLLYYGGADKSVDEEARKDFRDVAFWAPTVATDASGRAEVSFRWPDNLTTWRVTSRGATDATEVGAGVGKILVSKEIVSRLALPRGFVAGDLATLVSVVTNRSPAPLPGVEETIEVKGSAKAAGATSRKSDLPARGEARGAWSIEIPREIAREDSAQSAVFTFRARSKADQDALEVRAPVRARAVATFPHGAGVLDGGREDVPAPLPADLVHAGSEVRIDLSPSPAAMALGAVDYLAAYPYGCTEQTSNALLAALALLSALDRIEVVLPGFENPEKRLAPFLDRLAGEAAPEGGWGWWRESEVDPFLTALALDALARARAHDVMTPSAEQAMARGIWVMLRLLGQVRSTDGEAYVLAHLVPFLALPPGANPAPDLRARLEESALAVFGGRDGLGAAGLALAASAHASLGKKGEAKQLLELLLARAVRDGAGMHWPADPGDGSGWFGEEIENTACALSALLAVDPADARAPEVVRFLAARRRGAFWNSTRTTAPVVIALAEYLAAHPSEAKPAYRLEVKWNGETVLDRAVGPEDAFGGAALRVRLPGSGLRAGENRLALTKTGAGTVYWSWQAKALVPSPGPSTAAETRLAVAREYFRGERTTDRRGRPRYLVTPLDPKEPVRVGESILVRLTLRAPRALSYLVVEDPRVTGFEVDALLPEGVERPWGTHAEERDDRAVFFLDDVDEGETVLEYLIRPEIAGSFTALPASAAGMYDPDLVVRSGEARLDVVAK